MEHARVVAEGLRFPEGPVVLPDGTLLVCEMAAGFVARVDPATGAVERIAETGGGPNGAALGPDGALYVCNNGGWPMLELGTLLVPRDVNQDERYVGGSIQRVDLDTGEVDTVYEGLRSPNDIVFDADGGFWFTDYGKQRERDEDRGAVCYGRPDGSLLHEAARPLLRPNGIGLLPGGRALVVAETPTGHVWRWDIEEPGRPAKARPFDHGGRLVAGVGGLQLFDSLAVEADGRICVATLLDAGITVISPDGAEVEHVPLPAHCADPLPTNLCFAGDDMRTAYVTLSAGGRVMACRWPRPGLRLAF
ncbi:MAG TPA: SMP-30/gluconolactonase/LRE family protein [Acidimicrobiales bacterium]|nr:SMP-30/gluconolactonase/LRE family protein [Acidimicrobiales bacterium]